jgi:uncharacterized MAPEG superfamily protein
MGLVMWVAAVCLVGAGTFRLRRRGAQRHADPRDMRIMTSGSAARAVSADGDRRASAGQSQD